MFKPALIAATIFGALAVVIGAFGAHYLKTNLTPAQLVTFETGVKYQFYHTFALTFAGLLAQYYPSRFINLATWLFASGIVLFSGSLYLLSILASQDVVGLKGIGILTPIGGLLLVGAWICLLMSIVKRKV
jgi:uncharacterized membrane protein YgdD (TMEM256/DUF423 family)